MKKNESHLELHWIYTTFYLKETTALYAIFFGALAPIHYNVTEWSMARTGSRLQQLIHADRFLRGTPWSLTVSCSISQLLSVFYKIHFPQKKGALRSRWSAQRFNTRCRFLLLLVWWGPRTCAFMSDSLALEPFFSVQCINEGHSSCVRALLCITAA